MRCTSSKSRLTAIAVAVLLIAGCRGGGAGSSPMLPVTNLQRGETTFASPPKKKHKIDHIVIVIQENRTLENLFYDYPNAKTVKFGYGHLGQKIAMRQVSIKTHWDFVHGAAQFILACNGTDPKKRGSKCRMNGFDELPRNCHQLPCHPPVDPAYTYVEHDQIVPYLDMAQQYVLAANMFASDFDMSSFISHQYIIAGINPDRSANYPTLGAWGCPGGPTDKTDELLPNRFIKANAVTPCWKHQNTLGNELDKKGITWAYYATPIPAGQGGKSCGTGLGPDVTKGVAGIWSAYQTIKYICYGPDWKNDIIPTTHFLSDVQSGKLRAVTWITPRYKDSDHPGNDSDTGPSWVASVVNAIGKSKFWGSTAIFIFWDDPGGWYDPVPPPYIDGTKNDPSDSLGFRLPMLIISPYAKKGWVSQVQYEHGSILRFIEDRFGLGQLAASDTRATSPAKDCFDFSKPPRTFVPIASKYPESYFLHEPDDFQPPDND